jgi:hypothetical protein
MAIDALIFCDLMRAESSIAASNANAAIVEIAFVDED